MPVEIQTRKFSDITPVTEGLIDDDGSLTIRGQLITEYLNSVNYDNIFDALADHVEVTEEIARPDVDAFGNHIWVECDESHPDAQVVEVEILPAELVAEHLDVEELASNFAYYAQTLPDDTLTARSYRAVVEEFIDGESEDVSERKSPFKKGEFVKVRRTKGGAQKVNAMLGAMIAKGFIKRAGAKKPQNLLKPRGIAGQNQKQGTGQTKKGYRGGSYERTADYTKGGNPARLKLWRKVRASAAQQVDAKKRRVKWDAGAASADKKSTMVRAKEFAAGARKILARKGSKPQADTGKKVVVRAAPKGRANMPGNLPISFKKRKVNASYESPDVTPVELENEVDAFQLEESLNGVIGAIETLNG